MICLIRHGETEWNYLGKLQGKTDIPLNETGRLQANECRNFFIGSKWELIISSPLIRARETAEIINQGLSLPMEEMDVFKERSFGEAEGLTLEEINRIYPTGDYPGLESRAEVKERVMKGMKEINRKYPGKRILLVAHGAVINTILSEMSNGAIGSGKTKLINGCLSNVQFVEEKWKIHNYNQIDHLTTYIE